MIGSLNIFLTTSVALFCLGLFGVLIRRNALLVLMCIELMLNAVNMAFITFARSFGSGARGEEATGMVQAMEGHVFVLMIMAVAAAEAAIGIAIIVSIYRSRGRVLVDEIRELKG